MNLRIAENFRGSDYAIRVRLERQPTQLRWSIQ
jgi:hypothetical protein